MVMPRDIQVARPLGLGLDESAVENLQAWQFKPGTRNGIPVAVRVNEEVFFRPQRTLWDWHVGRAGFPAAGLAARPVLMKVKFPATVDLEENAAVTIAFDVGPKGVPANLRVVKSSDGEMGERTAGSRARRLAVSARMTDGKPVTVPAWFEFVRGSHSPIPPAAIPPAVIPTR